jgi:hypothetical protein
LFNYPAWKVTVNGKPVQTETSDVTGLMVIPVVPGENDVQIRFGRTLDQSAGAALSVIGIVVLGVTWMWTRPTRT